MIAQPFHLSDFQDEIRLEKEREATGANRMYSQAEHSELLKAAVEQARHEALDEGRQEGKREERESILSEAEIALRDLSPKLNHLLEDLTRHKAELEEQVLDFCVSICERVFPEMVNTLGKDLMLKEIQKSIQRCLTEPSLVIYTAERCAYELRDQIEGLGAEEGHKGTIQVRGHQDLSLGETRIEWENGFVEHSLPETINEIMSALTAAQQEQQSKG